METQQGERREGEDEDEDESVEPAPKRVKTGKESLTQGNVEVEPHQIGFGFGSGYAPKIEEEILLLVPAKDVLVSVSKVSRYLRQLCSKESFFKELMSRLELCEPEFLPASRELYLSSPERKWALVVDSCLTIKQQLEKFNEKHESILVDKVYTCEKTDELTCWKADVEGFKKTIEKLHSEGLQVPPSLQQLGHLTAYLGYRYGIYLIPGGRYSLEHLTSKYDINSFLFTKHKLFPVGVWEYNDDDVPLFMDLKTPPTASKRFSTLYALHKETKAVQLMTLESLLTDWTNLDHVSEDLLIFMGDDAVGEWLPDGAQTWFSHVDQEKYDELELEALLEYEDYDKENNSDNENSQ